MVWINDPDFGWINTEDSGAVVPIQAGVDWGDKEDFNVYHPSLSGTQLPGAAITMANLATQANLPPGLVAAGPGTDTSAANFLAGIAQQQALAAQAAQAAATADDDLGGGFSDPGFAAAFAEAFPATPGATVIGEEQSKEGDEEVRNGVTYIYTGGAWQPKPVVTPTPTVTPWDTLPEGSLEQILAKMNQDFYTSGRLAQLGVGQGTVGPYAALTSLYNDAATYLTAQGVDPTDESVYTTMAWFAEQAAGDKKVSDTFLWYDKNIADWIFEGRPFSVGGNPTATVFGEGSQVMLDLGEGKVLRTSDLAKITDPATRTRAATMLANNIVNTMGNTQDATSALGSLYNEYFDDGTTNFQDWSTSMGIQWDEAGGLVGTQVLGTGAVAEGTVSADGTQVYEGGKWKPISLAAAPGAAAPAATTIPDQYSGIFANVEEYNDWVAQGSPGAADLANLGVDITGATVPTSPFATGEFVPGPAGPATADILAGMQPQEDFKQDVFRRFLAEQVAPGTEQLQPLSPFMMRGAQNLYPQLLGEYATSVYDPANWTDAGNQQTFGDWLRAGERPTRESMFGTLGDISNVIGGGLQGITAPGISLAESLRRQNIMNQFGTETQESRQALQNLFSTAALRGVAPSFRYPVQSAAQGLFETQRALQPEKSFLSFLGDRMNIRPPTSTASFWTSPAGMARQSVDRDIGI